MKDNSFLTFIKSHPDYHSDHVMTLRAEYREVATWLLDKDITAHFVLETHSQHSVWLIPNKSHRLLFKLRWP